MEEENEEEFNELYKNILNNIKNVRKIKRISQEEMGKCLGISGQAYGKIELGKSELTLKGYLIFCELLKIDWKEILLKSKNKCICKNNHS